MNDVPEQPAYSPRSFSQVLDRIIHLLRAHWKVLVGISSMPPLVLIIALGLLFGTVMLPMLASMPKSPSPVQDSHTTMVFVSSAAAALLYIATFVPSFAAASDAAVRADLGEPIAFREAYGRALHKYGRYLLLQMLIWLIVFSPAILVELIFAGAFAGLHRLNIQGPAIFVLVPVAILAMLACFAFCVFAALQLSLALPASVAENLTAVSAIKRSNQLVRGAKGRIFLVLLIVYAVAYVANIIVSAVVWSLLGITALIAGTIHLLAAVRVVVFVSLALVFALTAFFNMALNGAGLATALGVIYNDQRMRLAKQAQAGD